MSTSTQSREQLLVLALGVLPAFPATVEVLSEDGGAHPLQLAEHDGELIHGYGPRTVMRPGLHLLARMEDPDRGRYEVEFEVEEIFFHSGTEALAHLAVTGVRRRKMRRAAPRVAVAELGTASVVYAHSLPRGEELDVRLVDISATGVAFTTRELLDTGDLVRLATALEGEPVSFEARVIRTGGAPYGRHRIGCEILDIGERERRLVASLASARAAGGSEAERREEPAGAPARPSAGGGLLARLHASKAA